MFRYGSESPGHEDDGHLLGLGFGVCCPICGGRMTRGSYFCARCRRHGRLHMDSGDIREKRREVFLPRGLLFH